MRNLVRQQSKASGFSLIELVITVTVMTILTLGVLPLVKVSVKRQKEQQLRDALRQMRSAIDEFHRDTIGMICTGTGGIPPAGAQPNPNVLIDPRSKVVISDCTIFGVDNPDRYPPSLEILAEGVNVTPRSPGGGGGFGNPNVNATDVGNSQLSTKKKVYLRSIPVNPFTGERDWRTLSNYDEPGSSSTSGENVFDVTFPPDKDRLFTPLREGQKYSEW